MEETKRDDGAGLSGSGVQRGVGRPAPERADACAQGCNGCDDCTDYDDEPREPPEFGCCLPPGECCMPGLHFPSECHTAADYERQHGADWREPPNVRAKPPRAAKEQR